MNAHDYARQNADRFIDQFRELLSIPSVSTLRDHRRDVERAAAWLVEDMQRIGMTTAEIHQQGDYLPLVYGEWCAAGDDAPTVLIYCHYDVQPAAISDGWDTDPFTPTTQNGKIYARGALDSKNHVIAHLKAVESMIASGEAPVNVKLLFEGEEESGSEHIFAFVADNPQKLKADVTIVSDGSLPDENQPLLVYGLRGIVTLEATITGPQRDLHSGHYGGTVHNPVQALVEMLAQLHDADGRVTVPGFYDAVRPLDEDERQRLRGVFPYVEKEWHAVAAAPAQWGEPDYTLNERIGARPTLELNGIRGGYGGEGVKTVLPSTALAKISCRLVPDQDPERIAQAVKTTLEQLAPPTVRVDVRILEMGSPGILIPVDTRPMQAAIIAYEKGWGVKPILSREGGSVPVVSAFQAHLDSDLVLMPYGYKGGRAHGPNEYAVIDMIHKGIATTLHFYENLPSS